MSAPFTLDAASLSAWQQCRRRYLLYSEFMPRRWRPHSLFDACLRRGIVALSRGDDPVETSVVARTELMTAAANPGLDVPPGTAPYLVAKDLSAMLATVLCALSRLTLLRLSPVTPVPLNGAATWRVTSLADDSGALHRWVTVAALDEDTLARELHGWYVAGDICATRLPLTLHVVVIGQRRGGRQASPWTRGWRHPTLPMTRIRFRKSDGSALKSNWTPVYLADEPSHDTPRAITDWVDGIERDGIAGQLIQHIPVDVPSDAACDDTVAQIALEAAAMRLAVAERRSAPYFAHPMSRGACDGIVPCVWQPCCYSPRVVDPATLPLYQIRVCDTVTATSSTSPTSAIPSKEATQ